MSNRSIVSQFISFLTYVGLQALLLNNFILYDTAFCFLYVAFLLLLPMETGYLLIMMLGFVTGFSIDIITDTGGIHASACVLLAWLRNYWIGFLTPQGGYDLGASISVKNMGLQWFTVYAFPLLFLHHIIVFFVEALGSRFFFDTLLKVTLSALLNYLMLVIVQYAFYKKTRSL